MVALSFQKQFRAPILARVKRHTLRNPRKHPIRVDQTLHLYTGLRTKYVKAIGIATCTDVRPIRLDLEHGRVESRATGLALTTIEEIDHFARSDGFEDWRAMERFWRKHHPEIADAWEGEMIAWGDTLQPAGGDAP